MAEKKASVVAEKKASIVAGKKVSVAVAAAEALGGIDQFSCIYAYLYDEMCMKRITFLTIWKS